MVRAQVRVLFAISFSFYFIGCSTTPKFTESKSEIPFTAPKSTLEPPAATVESSIDPPRSESTAYRSKAFDLEGSDARLETPAEAVSHRGGTPAPTFSAETLSGKRFDLAAQQGKVVVLDFWRESCGPCLKAMPKVADLRRKFPEDRLEILGVNTDERKATPRAYLHSHPHDWEQIHSRSQSDDLLGLYRVRLLPHFVVIDRQGNMQYRGGDFDTAAAKVAELIDETSLAGPATSPGRLSPLVSMR